MEGEEQELMDKLSHRGQTADGGRPMVDGGIVLGSKIQLRKCRPSRDSLIFLRPHPGLTPWAKSYIALGGLIFRFLKITIQIAG
jgi:hypothetical protein